MIYLTTADETDSICTGYGYAGWKALSNDQKDAEFAAAAALFGVDVEELYVCFIGE